MDFSKVEAEFQKLKRQFEAGALTEVEFKARLQELMHQDERGRWWMIGYETGQWYYHDGEKWVQSEPPPVAERRRKQVETLCQEGKTALEAGGWAVAIEKFEAALALEPGHPEATARLAEAKAQAEEARESEAKLVIATQPLGTLRRAPPWAYGRVAVLILLLLGFVGPWQIKGCSTTFTGTNIYLGSLLNPVTNLPGGPQGVVLSLIAIAVTVLFFVTLLRLVWRRVRENNIAIWLERIASGAALIGIGYGWYWARPSLWGFWSTVAGLLLAPLNLIGEHMTNRGRQNEQRNG